MSDSRVLAKLGSDLKKPDAVSLICEQNRSQVLDPLPIGSLLFVGRATARKLNAIGIYTVGQLAAADPQVLRGVLGKAGLTLSGFARGADDASLFLDDQPVKSVGNSTTTPSDVTDERGARLTLLDLSESVAFRLRQQGMAGRVVELSLRDTAMRTVTRQLTLDRPTDCSYNILDGAMDLLDRHWRPRVPLRALGVCVSALYPANQNIQLSFLPEEAANQRHMALDRMVDEIRGRYGHDAIRRGAWV